MQTHLNEDDLVLHYYGEMTDAEETRASEHLAACAACHASYRTLQRVLAVVDEASLAGRVNSWIPCSGTWTQPGRLLIS